MPKYRKKPIVIEAEQWINSVSRIPEVRPHLVADRRELDWLCAHCGHPSAMHGWIETLEGGHIVCPGDWIITGVKGELYPCKPDIFEATYEAVA